MPLEIIMRKKRNAITMQDTTKVLKQKSERIELIIEGENFKQVAKTFIESLYEPNFNIQSSENVKGIGIKEDSYSIRAIIPKDKNFKKFIDINKNLVYKYANNIKKNYDNKLLDPENEYSQIYLYIMESLYIFFKNHCNSDVELFKLYIEDSNKTYINSEDKKYTFAKYMYMSLDRMIKEENKLHEKSLEKGNMRESGRFARIDVDATSKTEDGNEKDIDLYSMELFTLLHDEDSRTDEQILKDNIKEMKRIQEKLLTVLTKSQMKFITIETYGCYFDIELNDFVMKEYSKQQRNQFFNQISKRISRDIKPFFIKKHNEKYVYEMIEYRRKNRKKLDATLRDTEDYINKHSNFKVSNIKI